MAHDVFVSYPHEDKAIADAVVNTLESKGIRCWVAPRDVPHGVDWAAAIVEAIGMGRMLVLVFSDATNSSDHILREVRAAGDADIPIVPFKTTAADPSPALKYYIGGTHWLDAMSGPMEQHLGTLTTTVARMLADDGPEERPKPARPLDAIGRGASGSWWSRLSTAARVGIGAAGAAVVALLAMLLLTSSGDDPVADGGDDSTTMATTSANEATSSVATSGTTETDVVTSGAGSLSDFVVEVEFVLANRDAANLVCGFGDGQVDCVALDPSYASLDVAVADFNNDGFRDVAFANSEWDGVDLDTTDRVCLGGVVGDWLTAIREEWPDHPTFECQDVDGGEANSSAVAAGDFDGDGNSDLVFGHRYPLDEQLGPDDPYARVCRGLGTGQFECDTLYAEATNGSSPQATAVEAADLDSDGDLDLVLAFASVPSHPNYVCLNDGSGGFTCEDIETTTEDEEGPVGDSATFGVAVGHFDANGDPDIYFANDRTPNRLCQGRPGAMFICSDVGDLGYPDYGVAVIDANGDGQDDVLVARWSGASGDAYPVTDPDADVLCLGDVRTASFECSEIPTEEAFPSDDPNVRSLVPHGNSFFAVGDGLQYCELDDDASYQCGQLDVRIYDDRLAALPLWIEGLALMD